MAKFKPKDGLVGCLFTLWEKKKGENSLVIHQTLGIHSESAQRLTSEGSASGFWTLKTSLFEEDKEING